MFNVGDRFEVEIEQEFYGTLFKLKGDEGHIFSKKELCAFKKIEGEKPVPERRITVKNVGDTPCQITLPRNTPPAVTVDPSGAIEITISGEDDL